MHQLKTILLAILFFCGFLAMALNNWQLQVTGLNQATISFTFDQWTLQTDSLSNGLLSHIVTPQNTYTYQKASPELPFFASSVWSTDTTALQFQIVDSAYTDYQNVLIRPSVGLHRRKLSDSVSFGVAYRQNRFWPQRLISEGIQHSNASVVGHSVRCFPVQYNPVTKTLRVFHRLVFSCKGLSTQALSNNDLNSDFLQLAQQHFLNGGLQRRLKRLETVDNRGQMLVVCPPQFLSAIQPFVSWKLRTGIVCKIIDASKYTSATALKTEIKSQCAAGKFAYLLLVGDSKQVPSIIAQFDQKGAADAEYGYLQTRDFYPDLMVGRFSGNTLQEIETQVLRSINYEQLSDLNAQWLTKYMLTASADLNIGDNGEYDFQHLANVRDSLQLQSYTGGTFLHDDTSGTRVTTQQFIDAFNKGSGLFFYTGHGLIGQFLTSSFGNAHVSSLRNVNQLPFSVVAGCQVGNFTDTTCLAEMLMRATWQQQSTGLVAIAASSIDQDWSPPMYMQDRFVELLKTSSKANGYHTFGALTLAACYATNDAYQSHAWPTTDTWNTFGDPSLAVRTQIPHKMTITANSAFTMNDQSLTFSCNDALAFGTLVQNNRLLAYANTVDGKISFTDLSITSLDPIVVTITAPNAAPWIDTLGVQQPSPAYLVVQSKVLTNNKKNAVQFGLYTDTLALSVTLKNFGKTASVAQNIYLSANNAKVLTNQIAIPLLSANALVSVSDFFKIVFSPTVPDNTRVLFTISSIDKVLDTFSIIVRAPSVHIAQLRIAPSVASNGDWVADAGELDSLYVKISNDGIFPLHTITLQATTNAEMLLLSGFPSVSELLPNQSVWIGNEAVFAQSNNSTQQATLMLICNSTTASDTAQLEIDLSYRTETWESATFTNLAWDNTSLTPWTIVSPSKFGKYSAQSGKISGDDSSQLRINVTLAQNDTVSFWLKTSCEDALGTNVIDMDYYDYLKFSIDNRTYRWAGETPWTRFSLPLKAGNYLAQWSYYKDIDASYYEDAVWIDNIQFPVQRSAVARVTNPSDTTITQLAMYQWQPRFSTTPDEFGYYRKPLWLTKQLDNSLKGLVKENATNDTIITWTKLGTEYLAQIFILKKQAIGDSQSLSSNLIVNLFPQPASNSITIQSNSAISSIDILSIDGQVVRSFNTHLSVEYQLSIADFSAGMYLLRIYTNNGLHIMRCMKAE